MHLANKNPYIIVSSHQSLKFSTNHQLEVFIHIKANKSAKGRKVN